MKRFSTNHMVCMSGVYLFTLMDTVTFKLEALGEHSDLEIAKFYWFWLGKIRIVRIRKIRRNFNIYIVS